MSVEPLKMAMREQHMKNLAEHKKFKESLTPSEQMDYQTFGKEYVLRGRDPAEKEKRDTEIEEKRQQLREEREEKVYGKELRITGQEGEEELETKVKARAQKDDEEYLAEKEKEKKLNEERKAKRLERMEANWKVSMTVKDMIALLRDNKVYGYGGKRKAELIEMIEKHGLKGAKKEEPKVDTEKEETLRKLRENIKQASIEAQRVWDANKKDTNHMTGQLSAKARQLIGKAEEKIRSSRISSEGGPVEMIEDDEFNKIVKKYYTRG